MPGFNGSGPRGQGPMTGRGMGACAAPEGTFSPQGRGMGLGMGRRGINGGGCRCFGFWSNTPQQETPEQILDRLQREKNHYAQRAQDIDAQISNLQKGSQ